MKKLYKYPAEVADYITANVAGKTTKQLTAELNEKFAESTGLVFTEGKVKTYKHNHGLKSGTRCGLPKGWSPKYPDGMEDYIRSIAPGRKTDEIARLTAEHFGIEFGVKACRAYKKNHGIRSGVNCQFQEGHTPQNKGKKMTPEQYVKAAPTMFKKGHVPVNHMEVGEYTHTTDGYLIRKVKETGPQWERFEFVHRAVWERHNGSIPAGKVVSFLDGNKDNCSIQNLFLLDNAENLEMNRSRLRFEKPELTEAGAALARLSVATRKRAKERMETADL